MTRILFLLILLLLPIQAYAKVLFEGFYKVEVKGVHAGYTIIRHSIDEEQKERTIAYYWMKQVGAVTSLTGVSATSTTDFKPIRYLAWHTGDGSIDVKNGVFKGGKLHVTRTIEKGGRRRVVASERKSVSPDVIFSSLVSQMQAANSNYLVSEYKAFDGLAEETSTVSLSWFMILRSDTDTVKGQTVYQVVCQFLNESFEFFTNRDGEVLGTRSSLMNQITYLVPNRDEAIGIFGLNERLLLKTFGDIPKQGVGHPVASSEAAIRLKKSIANWLSFRDLERR